MFSKINRNAGDSGDGIDPTTLSGNGRKLLEQQLPKIQAYFRETVGPVTVEIVQDDALMIKWLERSYKLVPLPVKLVIKKSTFVEFCLQNRYRIAGIDAPVAE